MNKINITINSRVYTVVAEEDTEYLERLCGYVNDKVRIAKTVGEHIMGEKPLVLAALNICDEYFKVLDNTRNTDNVSEILYKNNELSEEIKSIKDDANAALERIATLEGELELSERIAREAEEKIKLLEEQVAEAELRARKQRGEFAIRERELLDMLGSK